MSKAKRKKKGGTQDLCRLFQDMPDSLSESEEGYPPDYPFGKKKFIEQQREANEYCKKNKGPDYICIKSANEGCVEIQGADRFRDLQTSFAALQQDEGRHGRLHGGRRRKSRRLTNKKKKSKKSRKSRKSRRLTNKKKKSKKSRKSRR
jgi:hypothetical protein